MLVYACGGSDAHPCADHIDADDAKAIGCAGTFALVHTLPPRPSSYHHRHTHTHTLPHSLTHAAAPSDPRVLCGERSARRSAAGAGGVGG